VRHVRWISLGTLTLLLLLGAGSYRHTRAVAGTLMGPLPDGMHQFHSGAIPFDRHPNGQWGWVISYGPEPGDAHAAIYVSLTGKVIGSNPTDLLRRLPTRSGSRPAT
jgi:hypothetical protein